MVLQSGQAADASWCCLRRDRELGAEVADVAAKGVAGVATVGHDPSWHPLRPVEQRQVVGQLVGLSRRQHKRYGAAVCVGGDTGQGCQVLREWPSAS